MTPTTSPSAEPIPHIDTACEPFLCAAELRQRWRALMGPLGFGEHRLWFMTVTDDRQFLPPGGHLVLPGTPSQTLLDLFIDALHDAIGDEPGLSMAFLLTRPGRDALSGTDRRWLRMLAATAASQRLRVQPMFRANDVELVGVEVVSERAA